MPIHILKLQKRTAVANHTLLFEFEKPAGFSFIPGQYGGFTLINPTEIDAQGITRRFSLLSTPYDDYIAIATRIQSSAYKRALLALPIGATIKFAGPTGQFTLHQDETIPAVFIAGGIGIAPFYSMLRTAMHTPSTRPLYLFYGNQTPDDAAFLTELMALRNNNPHYHLIAAMANADSSWQGERGFINQTMLKKYLPDLFSPIFYVCGSPAMVTAIQELLAEMGVDENRIQVEDFPGY